MATSIDDLDAIINQGKGLVGNSLNNIFNGQSAQSQAEAQTSSPSYTPSTYTYTNYTPSAPAPSRNDFLSSLGQGMLGVGSSLWNGITTALDYGLAKPVQTALLYPTNAITALRDVGTGKASNWLDDFQNMTGNDVKNLWSQKDSPVAQQAIDRWAGSDPNNPLSLGHWVDPAAQLLSGGAEAKMLGEAGRLGLEGLGRIPGISGVADSYAASKAGQAFDAAQAAKAPETDPFASAPVDSVTVNPEDLIRRDSENSFTYQPSGFQYDTPETAALPSPESTALQPMKSAPNNTFALPSPQEPELINPGNSNRAFIAPNIQDAEYSTVNPRDDYVTQAMQQMSPGEKLADYLKDNVAAPIQNRVGQAMFKLGVGSGINRLSNTVRNAILNNRGSLDTTDSSINDAMVNLAKSAKDQGLTLDDLKTARNQYETGQDITNPAAKGLFEQLSKATGDGLDGLGNVGLKAEQAAGIAPDSLINNYIHLSTERPTMFDVLKGIGRDRGINPVTRGYANERYYKTADSAEAAGYKVRDPISSTADRLKESNKDLRNVELHQELADMSDKTPEVSDIPQDGMVRFQSNYAKSALNGKYVSPELNSYLKGLERTPINQKGTFLGALARGVDRATGLFRNLDMYNPLVHSHNIIGNALMAFGLKPSHYADAEYALGNQKLGSTLGNVFGGGTANPEMQTSLKEAQRTGALGAQHKDVFNQIKNIINPTAVGNVKNAYGKFQDAALWNRERAARLGVFHQARQEALAKGLSSEDASNVARDVTNQHMIDYSNNNLSPLEQELWSRLDPFYRWHKGNYPLQFQKLADPAAMVRVNAAREGFNNINQLASGHSMAQNSGTPNVQNNDIQFSDGTSYDPYLPYEEVNKVLNSRAGEFLWNRVNPMLKEPIQQVMNKQYAPWQMAQSDGHDYRAATPMTNPSDTLLEALGERGAHAARNLSPQLLQNLVGAWNYDPTGYKASPGMRIGLGATGGFVNTNLQTPQSDAMQRKAELNYMQKALRQKLRGK